MSSTIGEAWASYVAEVVPAAASEVQREECKRAFYAGAQGMYTAIMEAVEGEDEATNEARLVSLRREMLDWLRLFKRREGI